MNVEDIDFEELWNAKSIEEYNKYFDVFSSVYLPVKDVNNSDIMMSMPMFRLLNMCKEADDLEGFVDVIIAHFNDRPAKITWNGYSRYLWNDQPR